MPSVVDATASSSPTASVTSPGSAPREPAVEKRRYGFVVLLARPLVERLLLVLGDFAAGNRLVAPHRRPLVVRADPRDQIGDVDLVLRLRDVVEARVVHERRRVAHRLQPLRIAQLGRRDTSSSPSCCAGSRACGRPRARRRTRSAAHQIVGQRQRLRARIERADLDEVPVARQVHDVVVELDVRLEDLAACADRGCAGPTRSRSSTAASGSPSSARPPGSSPDPAPASAPPSRRSRS